MADRPEALLRHLRRVASVPAADPAPDAELLIRYVCHLDEDAFAALVRRHGNLVLGVCRRVLGDAHRAEDAFQAAWLVFARKAATICLAEGLAGWLHGVARQTARNALRSEARRRKHEGKARQAVASPRQADPLDELTARELLLLLDEEVRRLPKNHRLPVLCCCWEGLGIEEAAQRLGWTPGSVKGRLERGRRLLHTRLARRGIALSPALAVFAASRGTAEVPAALETATIRAALAHTVGEVGAASAGADVLAQEVLRREISGKVKAALGVLLLLGAASLGAGLWLQPPPVAERGGEPSKGISDPRRKAERGPTRLGTDRYGDPLPVGALARLGTERLRQYHSTADLATSFSPDAKTVLTAGEGTLKRWDVATGKLLRRFPGSYPGAVLASPNGRWLASPGGDLLDATSGEVVRRLTPSSGPLAFSPDSTLLATSSADGTLTLWDTTTGKTVRQLRGDAESVFAGAFSPNGLSLITLGREMKVCRWDVAKGKLIRTVALPMTAWRTLRLSPDGKTLAVSRAEEVRLWDTETGRELGKLGADAAKARYGLAFSGDGRTLATDWYDPDTREARVCLWDVATRQLLRQFAIPARAVGFLFFAPDNRTLASSGFGEPRLRLWDTITGRELHQHPAHDAAIRALGFTPNGQTLVSGSDDGTLRVWDAAKGRSVRELPGHPGGVSGLALTPDGRAVLSGGYDAQLLLQDRQTGKELRRLVLVPKEKLSPNVSYGPRVGLSADGRTAVAHIGTTDGGALFHLWDPVTGQVLARRADSSRVDFAGFSPDALSLATYVDTHRPATASKNPKAKAIKEGAVEIAGTQVVLQDVATGRPRLAIPLPEQNGRRATFSPDGRTLVTYSYRVRTGAEGSHSDKYTLHLWEPTTGKERLAIRSPKEGFHWFYEEVVFSPDGRTMATATQDRTIQLWDVATGAELLSHRGYEAAVRCLAFRPDGKVLASGHADSTILLWDLTTGAKRARPIGPPTPQQLEQAWADLASVDARTAHAAIWGIVAVPERAVAFLGARLRPAAPLRGDEIRKLLADLDSTQYERREAASRRLADLGEMAEAALEEALKADPSAEKRRRIEQLLATPRVVRIPEQLRSLRAVEALEHIGNGEARRVLEGIAGGAPGARLTREARASLERLSRRMAAAPGA
jgi:RNA polymerase sigma factor (sigma-70 family)